METEQDKTPDDTTCDLEAFCDFGRLAIGFKFQNRPGTCMRDSYIPPSPPTAKMSDHIQSNGM